MSAIGDASEAQRKAADGRTSAWVVASAGTGKTKVLTDRVLNLLLAGTPPGRILCLTFTKAAAAEMANRLNDRLSAWAIIGDVKLKDEIQEITGEKPADDLIEHARRLFARVLDAPGGMRILTIHAFCQSVLRRFPLEAGIPPQFEVMDDRHAAELLHQAQAEVLDHARLHPGSRHAGALAEVTSHVHEGRFAELMQAVTNERQKLAQAMESCGGLDGYLARLAQRLGVAAGETEAGCLTAACAEAAFDGVELRRAAVLLGTATTATDSRTGAGLAQWLALDPAARVDGFADYLGVFLTQKLEPRARLATKAVHDANPWLDAVLAAEQTRLVAVRRRLAAVVVNAASAGLTHLAAAFLDAYAREKRRRSLLDYDDLILATRDLLARPGVAPWVLFKLDGGIDHILIDEAQDTNPEQWEVVAALAGEFFAGLGARDVGRTVFAVGDAKQSIFSFQGADPQAFLKMRQHFAEKAGAAKQKLEQVPLDISFRSTAAVLGVVDAVFARSPARDGVALDDAAIHHVPARAGHAGRVELWPPLNPVALSEAEAWAPPVRQHVADAPRAQLARLIAETVAGWLRAGEMLPARGRAIRAGDILVLVRRRGGFVAELLRALKQHGIPVAGADRMVLTRQLAVMDLMALGRFLLLPEDDLTLATVLKSPLVGLDEAQLFRLAYGRPGSLWQALRTAGDPWAADAVAELGALLARADFVPPHELYAEILGARHGRQRLVGRLGNEASDAIDEFVSQTLVYEQSHVPSLQGFLDWLERGESEVKRDLDAASRDEVRIMTVHGSKGLQAPVVFLPDTLSAPTMLPPLLWTGDDAVLLWQPRRGAGEALSGAAKAAASARRDQEYRRLLYVALTRAEDRLYVCGWNTSRPGGANTWYDMVQTGMASWQRFEPITLPVADNPFQDPGLVHDCEQTVPPKLETIIAVDTGVVAGPLPDFAQRPPPRDPTPPRPLAPSRPSLIEPATRSPLASDLDVRRFRRGALIHRLMQTLPDLPPENAEGAARRYLDRAARDLPPEAREEILRETLAVLRHPEFAPLFGPGSRAEVPVVGLIDGKALSGRLDRLVVTADEVLIVDYKTNRPPPFRADLVAPAYVEQLAAYRAALERIYPSKHPRTLLLWTDGPRLMEILPATSAPPA